MSSGSGFATLILGGIPVSKDLAPSILFCVLYGWLGALWVYRMVKKETRSWLILRPGLFVQMRIATLAIRAFMSKGNYQTSCFIAELILLTVGLIMVLDPLIESFKSHISPFHGKGELSDSSPTEERNRTLLARVASFLRLLVLGILATGIAAGTMTSGAISDPQGSQSQSVHTVRTVNYVLSLVVIIVILLATVYSQRQYSQHLDMKKSLFLIGLSLVLLVPSAFKIATLNRSNPAAWVHSSSAFFVLLITFEFIACSLLLIFPVTVMFPSKKARQRI